MIIFWNEVYSSIGLHVWKDFPSFCRLACFARVILQSTAVRILWRAAVNTTVKLHISLYF